MNRTFSVMFLVCLVVFSASRVFAAPGSVDPLFLTGAGYNNEVVDAGFQMSGKLVVVGKFTSIAGFPVGKVARLDAAGHIDLTFNVNGKGANGDVLAVKVLTDGKILIAGSFTSYNGTNINRIARLNADGTLDSTFNPGTGPSSSVYQIVLQPDNKIVIAGGFSTVNGFASRVVARLFYDGAVDPSFAFTPELSFNEAVKALALQPDGKILFGGNFFGGDNGSIRNIARLDPSGNLDSTFQGRTNNGPNLNTPVNSIIVRPNGTILIGGQFTIVNGVSKINVALLNADGTLDNSFNATSINNVNKLAVLPDGRIVVGGSVQIQGQSTSMVIGLLHADGAPDNSFVPLEPNFSSVVNQPIVTSDNKILACGRLTGTSPLFGGANPAGVRRLNLDGTRDNTYLTKTGATLYPLEHPVVQSTGKIVLRVSDQGTVGGLARTGLARLNADGTVDENYAPSLRGTAIAGLPGDSILLGGVQIGGRYYFRKINPDGSVDSSYSVEAVAPSGYSFNTISDMAKQPDGKILAAGTFATVGGVARKSLVRLNADGTVDTSFNHNLTFDQATIHRVVVQPDGKIWISGWFTVGSAVTRALFRLNSSGTAETFTELPISSNSYIWDVSPLPNGKVYVGGAFTGIAQTETKYVGRLNQNGTVDSSFSPAAISGGTNGNSVVYSVFAQPDGKVLIGGDFNSVNGVARRGFARLNADGSLDLTFNTLVNATNSIAGNIRSIVRTPDGKILISGNFAEVGGVQKSNIARLLPLTKWSLFDFDGDRKTDISIFRSSVGEWWYLRSSEGSSRAAQFGNSADKITAADFTGDGQTDMAFWRPSSGEWFILRSEDASYLSFPFGTQGDVPAVGDFDGDGRADPTIFRPTTATWFVLRSSDGGVTIQRFGAAGDIPVVADYDGDGRSDLAIYRPSAGEWWIQRSSNSSTYAFQFGTGTDKVVPGDFTGDGLADAAFYRPSTGEWFIIRSEDSSYFSFPFGASGDIPAPGDYDGDGRMDATVFRPSTATWYSNRTTDGVMIVGFGSNGDQPVPAAFIP